MPANAQPGPGPVKAIEPTFPPPACEVSELSQPSRCIGRLPFNFGGSKPTGSRLPKTLASLFFSSFSAFQAHANRRTARRPVRRRPEKATVGDGRRPEKATVGDGDATAAPLAGARAQHRRAAPPWRPLLDARTHARSLTAAVAVTDAPAVSSRTSPSTPS